MFLHSRVVLVISVVALLLLTGFTNQQRPNDRSYYESRGEVVWEVPMNEKLIALTFDDGPDPKTTPQILELLSQYDAHATFFVIGNRMAKYPDIVKQEAFEGHEVANHTYNHVYFTPRVTMATIQEEIVKSQQQIEQITNQSCHWFRPPGGYYNEKVIQAARSHGYTVVLWSWHQDTNDWRTPGVKAIADKVLRNARNGDIVLLHDHVKGSNQTVEALKLILPELKNRGYRLVTVTELMEHKRSKASKDVKE
ncbi:MAG: polysaccharide deacetylase family protein [Candidatus Cohnella colombiensis]|uniref:Polysaccharide deacetylase family protein n=1 Tax=Candidatus Cohnella colombiensis TaxID=3121368 RepID=A0AA95JGZ7_9BACL|nr:MAG: polysaccharide deacetylase family protein [Cohnella sp.]